jgi:hypothetical protein
MAPRAGITHIEVIPPFFEREGGRAELPVEGVGGPDVAPVFALGGEFGHEDLGEGGREGGREGRVSIYAEG